MSYTKLPTNEKDGLIPVHGNGAHIVESQRPRKGRFAKLLLVSLVAIAGLHGLSCLTSRRHGGQIHKHARPLRNSSEVEELFLSVPGAESALAASRAYATHPHLAGSKEDFADAKVILELFQKEFGIIRPETEPIFNAGTEEARNATLNLSSWNSSSKPSAWIDVYHPFMNTPLDRAVEIVDDDGVILWEADLVEEVDPLDEDAHKYQDYVPTWHGLSRNGSAVGQLVYANRGSYEDYQSLKEQGVDLTGKIVIVRYGGLFRGLKVKGAEELGAVGVLIYSDPKDDGYVTVENGYAPYPAGPARAPASVQRGSVQYLSIYPGDPTTEGYPSYKNTTRQEGRNIPKIPSLPISWKNAERLLEEIGDLYHPESDANGLRKLTGKASESKVKLVNHVDDRVIPIYNTLAAIPGHIRNEVVLVGGHRDAWVLGAADPTSGTVSLHEIIKGFGALLRSGWKPLRTVVFASWDAEEYGLIGSTEYGEDFGPWLKEHVVTYLNVDVSVSGSRFHASASPSLAHLIQSVASQIPHPTDEGRSLWDAREDTGPFSDVQVGFKPDAEGVALYSQSVSQDITPLGSGSDYSTYLQHLGIASSDQGFGGTLQDAPYHYHSVYDSQRWQEVYADPGFHRHVAVAKHLGLLALRIIDGIILPINTTHYALELESYLDQVKAVIPDTTDFKDLDLSRIEKAITAVQEASLALDEDKAIAERKFKELLDQLPFKRHRRHHRKSVLGHIKRSLRRLLTIFKGKHVCLHRLLPRAWEELLDPEVNQSFLEKIEADLLPGRFLEHVPVEEFIKAAKHVSKANKKLSTFEQGFISKEGIKDREWYKHLGVAPGKWLGYGASTLPALTESIVIDQNKTLAIYEANRLSGLLEALAAHIRP